MTTDSLDVLIIGAKSAVVLNSMLENNQGLQSLQG